DGVEDGVEGGANAVAAAAPAASDEATPVASSNTPLLLVDSVLTHQSADAGGNGAFSFVPNSDLKRDLADPVDYAGGTLYQRLDVRSKPSDEVVHYQLCLVPNDAISVQPACAASNLLSFSGEGVFEANVDLSEMSGYQSIDWENGVESLILVVKNDSGLPVDNRYALGDGAVPPDPALYYPMEVRFTAVLVPAGGRFTGWPQ
ncbi:MAG: hypothetical protein WD314_04795, partial [Trueperaceae bacterium]